MLKVPSFLPRQYPWMQDVINGLIQFQALRIYRTRLVQHLLASSVGRWMFEAAYFRYKEWIEVPGTDVLKPFVVSDAWVIDVGANIGFFTEKFARWIGEGGKVLALEPEVTNFRRLEQRLRQRGLADRIMATLGAAADCDGRGYLSVNPDHPGDHALSETRGLPVVTWRIDTLLAAAGFPSVGLIKIDVQGAEMKVLAGCAATLARCRPAIFIEIDDGALKKFGSSGDEVLSWLEASGYGFSILRRSCLRTVTRRQIVELVSGKSSTYCDILAQFQRSRCSPTLPNDTERAQC